MFCLGELEQDVPTGTTGSDVPAGITGNDVTVRLSDDSCDVITAVQ